MERTQPGSWLELHASLQRLQVESFDLYQIHAVTNQADLDDATRKGCVIETLVKARQEGPEISFTYEFDETDRQNSGFSSGEPNSSTHACLQRLAKAGAVGVGPVLLRLHKLSISG